MRSYLGVMTVNLQNMITANKSTHYKLEEQLSEDAALYGSSVICTQEDWGSLEIPGFSKVVQSVDCGAGKTSEMNGMCIYVASILEKRVYVENLSVMHYLGNDKRRCASLVQLSTGLRQRLPFRRAFRGQQFRV